MPASLVFCSLDIDMEPDLNTWVYDILIAITLLVIFGCVALIALAFFLGC